MFLPVRLDVKYVYEEVPCATGNVGAVVRCTKFELANSWFESGGDIFLNVNFFSFNF